MCAMTVPTTCTAIRRARFGAPVRQNNQNSQNEPGMSFGINQIVNRGAEEGAWPLKNKGLLTMLAPYCESQANRESIQDCPTVVRFNFFGTNHNDKGHDVLEHLGIARASPRSF